MEAGSSPPSTSEQSACRSLSFSLRDRGTAQRPCTAGSRDDTNAIITTVVRKENPGSTNASHSRTIRTAVIPTSPRVQTPSRCDGRAPGTQPTRARRPASRRAAQEFQAPAVARASSRRASPPRSARRARARPCVLTRRPRASAAAVISTVGATRRARRVTSAHVASRRVTSAHVASRRDNAVRIWPSDQRERSGTPCPLDRGRSGPTMRRRSRPRPSVPRGLASALAGS